MRRLSGFVFLLLASLLVLSAYPAYSSTLINSTNLVAGQVTATGGCTGVGATRTELFCNSDGVYHTNNGFSTIPGRYLIAVNGSSSNNNAASADIFVGGANSGRVTFTGTTRTVQFVTFDVNSGSSSREVRFVLTNDNGSSDTFLYSYSLYYEGAVPTPRPAPSLPSQGAALTGNYRNLFAEWGRSSTEIQTKISTAYNSLFGGSAGTVYYTTGSNMAYILDTGNNDIRSEGISYGMMIAVQMNDQDRFNRLWRFAKTYMQCPNANFNCETPGMRDGYFAWQLSSSAPFAPIDRNPAPDGEEYMATALLFAAGRWGNGSGILNYQQEAQIILNAMLVDNRPNSFHSLFNLSNYLIVFSPNNQSALMTDPSYHLPAFYEVWARYDSVASNRAFWANAAIASRNYWTSVIGSRTNGLMPDCTNFSGTPITGCAGGTIFAYDAWRAIANVAVDYAWWVGDSSGAPLGSQVTWSNQLQAFFGTRRPSYQNRWNLDGTPVGSDFNSPGHVSMNAVAGLAGNTTRVWDFLGDIWALNPPTGQYRYYDGLLYMMGLLHLSGNFRMYASGGTISPTSTNTPAGSVPTATNTPLPTATPIPTTGGGGGSAYNRIEAETHNSQSGTTNQATSDSTGGGQDAVLNSASSYIVFNNLNFGTSGPASVQIRASTTVTGVNVVFRTGSPTGTAFCTLYPASGGTYQTTSNTCYPSPTGTQTVYVTVTGGPVKLNWIQFTANGSSAPTNTPPPAATNTPVPTNTPASAPTATPTTASGGAYNRIEAETFSSQSGTTNQTTGDSTGGGQDVLLSGSSSYIVFNNLDFGANGAAAVQIRASTTLAGVNVVFRTGSPTGTAICTLYPSADGSYQTTSNTCYPRPTGVQTIYVTVTGGPVKLNWIQFSP